MSKESCSLVQQSTCFNTLHTSGIALRRENADLHGQLAEKEAQLDTAARARSAYAEQLHEYSIQVGDLSHSEHTLQAQLETAQGELKIALQAMLTPRPWLCKKCRAQWRHKISEAVTRLKAALAPEQADEIEKATKGGKI